jgi:hypothetical protein
MLPTPGHEYLYVTHKSLVKTSLSIESSAKQDLHNVNLSGVLCLHDTLSPNWIQCQQSVIHETTVIIIDLSQSHDTNVLVLTPN